MRCKDFEVRLQEVLDEREPPESDFELTAHAAVCARCRALAEAYDTLFDGLAASPGGELQVSLADRVMVRLTERNTIRHDRRLLVGGWVAAAAVALAVLPLWRWNQATSTVATVAPNAVAVAVVNVKPGSLHADSDARSSAWQFVEFPDEEYTDLARETGRNVAALVRCLPSLNLDPLAELSAAELRGPSSWMPAMPGDIEPFARSMAEALQMILEAPAAKPNPPANMRAS